MKIVAINNRTRWITLDGNAPQHWTRCLINLQAYSIVDTKRSNGRIMWQLDRTPHATVGMSVNTVTTPAEPTYQHDALSIAADYDLPVGHLFGMGK